MDGSAGIGGIVTSGMSKRIRLRWWPACWPKAPPGQPLNGEALEQSLLVANELPGVKKIRANLAPGSCLAPPRSKPRRREQAGHRQRVGRQLRQSPPAPAAWSFANLNSPTGYGDLWSLTASKSSGMTSGRAGVVVPPWATGRAPRRVVLEVSMDFAARSSRSIWTARRGSRRSSAAIRSSAAPTSNISLSGSYDAKNLTHNVEGTTDSNRKIDRSTSACSATGWTASAARALEPLRRHRQH